MPTLHHYTSCLFLPEIDKSSECFRVVTFGVSVEHFGISLQTGGKDLRVRERNLLEKMLNRSEQNEIQTLYSSTEQCNLIWWQVIIEFVL